MLRTRRVTFLLLAMVATLLLVPSRSEADSLRQADSAQPSPPPTLRNSGRSGWSTYLTKDHHSAFAIGGNGLWGSSWGYRTVQGARERALSECPGECEVISVDGALFRTYPAADPDIPPLSLGTNGQRWWSYYTSRPNNKAFAMGLNGRAGVATRRASVDAAREAALDYCNDGQPQSSTYCAIVSVNGRMFNNTWLEAGLNPPPTLYAAGRDRWRLYHMVEGHKAFYALPGGWWSGYSWQWRSLQEADRAAQSACGSGCNQFSRNGITVKFYEPVSIELAPIPSMLLWVDYVQSPGHKALAASTRKSKIVTRQVTVDEARRKALADCGSGCAIIAIDDFFVDGAKLPPPPGLSANGRRDWELYLLAYGHKAFAMNDRGGYGYSWGWSTPLTARRSALEYCRDSSCQIVSVNNDYRGLPPGSDNLGTAQSTAANAGTACNDQSQCPDGTTCTDVSGLEASNYRSNALAGKVCMPSNPVALTQALEGLDSDVCTALVGGRGTEKVAVFSDMARELNATVTVGTGYGGGVALAGTTEAGVMIGPNGQAGCYISQCIGVELDVQGSIYESLAIYPDWENVPGRSLVYSEGASIPGLEAGYSTAQVTSDGQLLGVGYSFSAGLGIIPVDFSLMSCNTGVVQVRPTLQRWEMEFSASKTSKKDYYDERKNWAPTGLR